MGEFNMSILKTFVNSRYFIWSILALPACYLLYSYLTERLYYGELMHATGEYSGRLLIISMAVTPLRLMLPNAQWPVWLLQRRRYLGVATFGYALLHVLLYLEKIGNLPEIIAESSAFEYWTGWLGFLILMTMATTSNDWSVRLLKSAWKKLHRWIYVAALLSFLHWIFVAFNFLPGLIHALLLAGLEAIRKWKSGQGSQAAA